MTPLRSGTAAASRSPERAAAALLLIDVINDLEFDGGEALLAHALPAAERLSALKARAARAGIPAIYVNDNFGRWQASFERLLDHCLRDGVRGEPLARLLAPAEPDYFVLKPKHSGFYGTTLDVLLGHLGVRSLIVTGIAGNICVLFTAADAHMRGFRLHVPSDCVASEARQPNEAALGLMRDVLDADLTASAELDLDGLCRP